jgi:geranylgeranyl pyrophosphate synthase
MNELLAGYRAAVDRTLAEIAAEQVGTDRVSQAMRYAIMSGGKRLRPSLCLAAMRAVRHGFRPETVPAALRAAAAVELVHTYSLVHDDLPCMDNDALRRGRPTTHRVYGSRAAMLAGIALVPRACRILFDAAIRLGADATVRKQALRELCTAAGAAGMVGGKVLDLEAEGSAVDMRGLRCIHTMKTGALFRASLRIGGLLGGGDARQVHALGAFGERLGLAFQITDDVLDVTMEESALGKTPGKDAGAAKVTFTSLLGVASARCAAEAEVESATAALRYADLRSELLAELAGFAVNRNR